MKKKSVILIIVILLIFGIFILFTNKKVETPKYNNIPSESNVTISVIEDTVTPTGCTIHITDKNEQMYNWGNDYSIQCKINNDWQNVQIIQKTGVNEIAYLPNENGETILTKDWSIKYGTLPKGTYRIVLPNCTNGKYHDFYSNEFIIK